MKRKKAYYSISAVAEMFSVHQQTIRLYEKEGLISPKRSEGNTRLFSEDDVNKLEHIIHLTHELGINLAGVEMILKLQKKIDKLQKEINRAFAATNDDLKQEALHVKKRAESSAQKLLAIKQGKPVSQMPRISDTSRKTEQLPTPPISQSEESDAELLVDQWEIDYEE